jgi:AcrR family transcriptional regulator
MDTNKKPTLLQQDRYGLQYRGTECMNCNHPLDVSDKFCPNCSQANSTKKVSFKDFFDEFFASLISYDSRLLKTLSALLTKPGKITEDYVKGKRISYTNPFRFLLSLSIIYFLMLNFTGDFGKFDRYGEGQNKSVFNNDGFLSFNSDLADGQSQEKQILVEDTDELMNVLDSLEITDAILKKDSILMSDPITNFSKLSKQSFFRRFGSKREFFNALINKEKVYYFEEIPESYKMESTRENRSAFNAAKSYARFKQQPGSFLSSIISKLPFAVFFFLPAFAMFIWVAYVRKKYTYAEHLIFSFHNQSLLFILLIISFLVDSIFEVFSGGFFLFAFSIYLFLAMKRFYKQGFFKTIVKYVFLNTIFFILATVTMAILLAGSIYTY